VPAPGQLDSAHVVVAGNDVVDGSGCNGSATTPVAAPGFVCIYASGTIGSLIGPSGYGIRTPSFADSAALDDGSPYGFVVQVSGSGAWQAHGVWAYTAP
jgi:hypothetical protein